MPKDNHSNSLPSEETNYRSGRDRDGTSTITFTPIGVFKTDYTPETGGPRQGILKPEGKGEIHIFDEYRDALKDLGLFEYIIVIYHFSGAGKWSAEVTPPAATSDHRFGLFATRSPKRPNPIGFTVLKLDDIKNGILYVSGVDAFDGSPVLDLKPFLPSVDGIKSIHNEQIEKYLGHHDEDFITDKKFYK
ncbi:MAG: tRNA (N6-threonylcarbamoyladenosine(37)-N6)-methyltransferase TrmO [Chlorobi bacterium]|nr:tRNA (N6-threonylcarbamoyladenosine(37)-N6)-methyltransferase TrmO [Chlorobiota bacterium]